MAYRDVVLTDSPVDYYEMETSTGTDSGSGGRTLTLSGVTTDVAGRIGDGWSFDGVNDTASMATWPSLTTAFTFEAWVKPNLSGVSDTPTVIRRDGTDVMLLRVRGSALGVNPGQAEVYADGLTLLSTSSYRVDDGNWHHLVYTQSGNAAKLYVDGVERASGTTSQSTFNMGSGTGYIGSANGTGEWYKGVMDEVAVYNTALSPTRVLAHYNGSVINGGYTAQAMTASATAPDAVGAGNDKRAEVVNDATISSQVGSTNTNYGSDTAVVAGSPAGDGYFRGLFKIPDVTLDGDETVVDNKLVLTRSATATAGTISIYRITSNWDESTVTYNSRPTSTLIDTVSDPGGASGSTLVIDLDGVMSATNYGIELRRDTSQANFHSSEASAGLRPIRVSQVALPVHDGYAAEVMTASATFVDASVSTTSNGGYAAQAMTASALMVDPVVTAEQFIDLEVTAEPMVAAATWPTATGFALTINVDADPMTATADTVDAVVTTQRGPIIAVAPMTAVSVWKQASEVNGEPIVASEVDDRFFQRVMSDAPSNWFRFNDGGAITVDRMNPTGDPNPAYFSGAVQMGQNNGPDGRHSVHFTGSGFWNENASSTAVDTRHFGPGYATLEFYIRTDKRDQFIMVSGDSYPKTGLLYLKDGKIHQKDWGIQQINSQGVAQYGLTDEFTGFTDIADGNWHQIVIASHKVSNQDDINDGIWIYIDGKFEIRRWLSSPWWGVPDYIGSVPAELAFFDPGVSPRPLPSVPSSQNFVGDMTELVYYGTRALGENTVARHYYDFMGWTPIEATSMDAFAFAPDDARGRGNQKRALYLWWDKKTDAYNVGESNWSNKPNMDPILDGKGNYGIYDLEGYKVFAKSVTDPQGDSYRDEVYDRPTLIDLERDVDIEDYDVIMFGDWPDEGSELDILAATFPNFAADKERLIRQLRDANDKGIGLLVTQPRLAVDLGIVNRVEWTSPLQEYVPGRGLLGILNPGIYDYGSALHFPWNIAGDTRMEGVLGLGGGAGEAMNTDPDFLANKAYFYGDSHKNDRFRVRAIIEGLTDIPSYMYDETIHTEEIEEWGWSVQAYKYLHRMNGLQIGDEFIFHGSNKGLTQNEVSQNFDVIRAGRWRGTWATHVDNVLAGTVVTTFGAKHWLGQQEVDNPYRDYATTIVLRPGDTLAGRRVGGRIFVNYSEQPNRFELRVPVDVLPDSPDDTNNNVEWPLTYPPETAAQREWEYSGTRETLSYTRTPQYVTVAYTMPDGSIMQTQQAAPGGGGGLHMTRGTKLFPTKMYPMYTMVQRGMWWLAEGVAVGEGDVFPTAAPMTATAAMPNPVVTGQKDGGYNAQPMYALAQMPKVAEDQSGDAEIHTLPATAYAEFTGFSKVISAGPMTATAELVESFDMVHTTGEQVVLTLHYVSAQLYLKEEA